MALADVLDAVANPDDFFAEWREAPSLWQPAVIVSIVALSLAAQVALTTPRILAGVEEIGQDAIGTIQLVNGVVLFLATFVIWLLVAGVVYVGSAVAGGDRGSIGQTLGYVGWGFLPMLISSGLTLYVTWDALQQTAATGQAFTRHLQSLTSYQVLTVVGIAVILWQGFIWAYGTHHVRGLSVRRSAVVAAVPVAGLLLLSLAGVV